MVNLLGSYIGGRLDLTPGNAYTLSPATGRIVRDLDDLVTVKVFASKELPTEVALMKRDVDDLLRDLRSAGHGQVRIIERDPSDDEAARREAESLGIQPVQFNVIGQAELQVKQGYLGLAVQHGGADRDHPVRPAHRRPGVPAGLDHPAAEPGQEAGDRLRHRRHRARRPRSRRCRSSSAAPTTCATSS